MRRVALALALALALLAVSVAPVSAATSGPESPHAASCFPGDGTEFTAGTEGPQVQFSLHASLFPAVFGFENDSKEADPPPPNTTVDTTATGAFGVEAAGTTGEARIVSLRAGVLFDGSEAAALLRNPFEPFAFVFEYRLRIPAFVGTGVDPDYRIDDAPVSGPVEEAAGC